MLTGKAKFGIFGDGKEVPQVAMAKFFMPGDFCAGYYRDQTFAFATGIATINEFFSQLYADPNPNHDPHSAGRQMNSHFCSPFVDEEGEFLDLANRKNLAAGIAPTAGHMPKAFGLAYASKVYRNVSVLQNETQFSKDGNEVCFATIGEISNNDAFLVQSGKAGRTRWLGKRPTVRGSVMNACDHPHGGGEGRTPIGRTRPLTPWGKPALGKKTRKTKKLSNTYILRRRS